MSEISESLMTIEEVAEHLRVAKSTMRNKEFRQRLGLKSVRVGKSVRFRREDVEAFVKRNVEGGKDA